MPTQTTSTQPLVSFIITCYNLETPLLKQCLDSVLSLPLQSDQREIILVDDGSKMSPINDLHEYSEAFIYLRQHNQGLSVARNNGMAIARGRYIQFVDGDDYLITTPYRQCLDIIKRQQPDMLLFQFTSKQSELPIAYNKKRAAEQPAQPTADEAGTAPYPTVSGPYYLRHNNLRATAWGYIFRRSMLASLSFTPGILHEDEEFTPQLVLRADSLIDVPIEAYYYRQRENSIVSNTDKAWVERRLGDSYGVILRLKHLADRSPEADKQGLLRRVAQLTMDYIHNVVKLTRDRAVLEQRVDQLYADGLFPLPDEPYTSKYTWFRRLSATKTGRTLLFHVIAR